MNESNEWIFPVEEFSTEEVTTEEAISPPPENALGKKEKRMKRIVSILSFGLPFLIASIAYVASMLFTDGVNMLLHSDGWHQYYPFLVTLREKILGGGSMEYSWVVGMGASFPSLFAYYLASPMYLLCALVPLEIMPHFFTLLTVTKLALAGFCFTWFLRLVYQRTELSQVFFGLLYAFCAWAAGFYWNIMWLDTFALLPLLIAATVCLLRDGKFKLYIISLALSLWCNYYVAFFCCIFVLLCFVGYCICRWNGFANLIRRFFRIGVCTLVAVGLACALLIPTLLAMQTTYSSGSKEFPLLQLNITKEAYGLVSGHSNLWEMIRTETIPGILSASREVLTGLMPGDDPASLEGLPNIFCGFSTVMLGIYFFCCKKISLREKLVSLGLLIFILLSFILRWLDYVWHGLHFPNMIPYRFSFLFSFVLIAMAYRAFTLLDDFKLRHLCFIIPISTVLFVNAYYHEEFGTIQKLLTGGILGAMVIFFALYYFIMQVKAPQKPFANFLWKHRKSIVLSALLLLLAAESTLSLASGININKFSSQYSSSGELIYPRENEPVQALLGYLDDKADDPLFYRTEVTSPQTLNDAALNAYNGVTIFNSSTNANFNRLTRSLGLASWVGSNRFAYYESSPFTNTMCGIKYLLDRSSNHFNTDYNALLAKSDNVLLLENEAFISVGFMTDIALADFLVVENAYNPIREQKDMFRLATGVEDELYTHLTAKEFEKPFSTEINGTGTSGTQYTYDASTKGSIGIVYTLEEDGLYIATTKRPTDAESKVKVYCNNRYLFSIETKVRMIFCVGNFKKGDQLKFVYTLEKTGSGNISLDLAKQNNAVFNEGLQALADEPFVLSEFSDGYLRGTIDVKSEGLFYTSVPYEPGWTAYVDGKEVKIAEGYDVQDKDILLSDAVICFALSEGTHEIELVYHAPGMKLGICISLGSLLIFVALCVILRKKNTFFADKEFSPKEKKDLPFAISSLPAFYLTADLIRITIQGAKIGYAELLSQKPASVYTIVLSLLKGKKDDLHFVVFSVLAAILIPITLYLCYRFWRFVWMLMKQAQAKQLPTEPEEAKLPDLLPDEPILDKKALRKQIREQKKALTEEQICKASEDLMRQMLNHPFYQNAQSIYGYLSYNEEVRTEAILRQAQADGKRIAVPKIVGDVMEFHWLDWDHVEIGYKGIPEPTDGNVADDPSALVLMPGLAFDREGHRVGYGGGFYDRFLEKESHPTLALCYDFQMFDHLQTEEFDIPVDVVLSAPTKEE